MIKQDFLLVQIEELAKKLAKLLKKKETPGSNTDTLADDCYKDIHLSLQEVQNATAEELTEKVPDWELLELLVKLFSVSTLVGKFIIARWVYRNSPITIS